MNFQLTRTSTYRLLIGLAILIVAAVFSYGLIHKAQAPDVTFTTLSGKKIPLSSLRGKVVYIDFWATDCPGCVKEVPELKAMYQQYHARGLELIGVNMAYDPPAYVLKFIKKYQVPYPDALDPQGKIAHAFGGVLLIPTGFLISKHGRILQNYVGEPDFAKLYRLINQELP
ncbi:MAG: TlpA family protein disulfide reductase [Pseudomonadota bacterium]|nr:TlpA family protein disulfide reductase [Pseudomonadota bacterium]